MKAIVMTLVAVGAAVSMTPASAQNGYPGSYRSPYQSRYGFSAAGGCASGHCSDGGCATGACADLCGCEEGVCETGRCGSGCDMDACGDCRAAGVRPGYGLRPSLPPRPTVHPAPGFGRRPVRPIGGGYGPRPFMAERAARTNW